MNTNDKHFNVSKLFDHLHGQKERELEPGFQSPHASFQLAEKLASGQNIKQKMDASLGLEEGASPLELIGVLAVGQSPSQNPLGDAYTAFFHERYGTTPYTETYRPEAEPDPGMTLAEFIDRRTLAEAGQGRNEKPGGPESPDLPECVTIDPGLGDNAKRMKAIDKHGIHPNLPENTTMNIEQDRRNQQQIQSHPASSDHETEQRKAPSEPRIPQLDREAEKQQIEHGTGIADSDSGGKKPDSLADIKGPEIDRDAARKEQAAQSFWQDQEQARNQSNDYAR